ncbi:MAG: peptidyl-tRNA hydrolase Pth2 [Sulfolobales archaeon]
MSLEEEYKQTIIVRSDLKMSPGKLAVQVAHASVDAVLKSLDNDKWRKWLNEWIVQGMKKVVVKVDNEKKLLDLYEKCVSLEIPCSLVRDAGRTELEPGTLTAVGAGPAPSRIIDKISGNLPLL